MKFFIAIAVIIFLPLISFVIYAGVQWKIYLHERGNKLEARNEKLVNDKYLLTKEFAELYRSRNSWVHEANKWKDKYQRAIKPRKGK